MKSTLTLVAVAALAIASTCEAQIVLQKAVVSDGGGMATNGTTVANMTAGQAATRKSSNGITTGQFGFWNEKPVANSSVRISMPSSIRSVSTVPNPASSEMVIKANLATSGTLDLAIYDASGKLVTSLFSGYRNAGLFELKYNVTDLATGVYFLAASMPGTVVQSRFTVVK